MLLDILRNRDIELAFQGCQLADSRHFGRLGTTGTTGTTGAKRNRTFYPYPRTERENNSSTPADPAI